MPDGERNPRKSKFPGAVSGAPLSSPIDPGDEKTVQHRKYMDVFQPFLS